MNKKIIYMVLGIRPDIIRASIIIKKLREELPDNFKLVWSGQHYSDNLKDVFFRELDIAPPDINLAIQGNTDAELTSDLIVKLSQLLIENKPTGVIFLGDTNTVIGSIAAAQLNIPILHIEGCMRSYDWRMPEEKNRKIIDHLSDRIYSYLEEYTEQGLAEGIPKEKILTCGNPIVDVLKTYFLSGKLRMPKNVFKDLLNNKYGILDESYGLLTSHRRENVEDIHSLTRILNFASKFDLKIIFPASYRTQKAIVKFDLRLPVNVVMVDPIGYLEILEILISSKVVITDSGTLIEEAAILGTPSVQMRTSTERPQVYDIGASIKFDPHSDLEDLSLLAQRALDIPSKSWTHNFGTGDTSEMIVSDIVKRFHEDSLSNFEPRLFSPFSDRSFG